jgi:hypothetical protein
VPALPALETRTPSALRRNQTLRELDRLQDELEAWGKLRHDTDTRGQYRSQVEAIESEVSGAVGAIRAAVSNLGAGATTTGELYERLARIDRQIIWARFAWSFFRRPFDQRDDPMIGPALRAADEMAWSCFKPLFETPQTPPPPAPLACIELDYSPSTLLTTHAHAIERPERPATGPLGKFFEVLPIPLLRLPPAVVTAPWMLTLIGHEIGHVLYEHAKPGASFPEEFEDRVTGAVIQAGGTEDDQLRWRSWATEIFADWYGLLMVGTAALWTLGQFDFGSEARMAEARRSYPAARIRLVLLARMAEQLGLAGAWTMVNRFGVDAASATALAAADRDARIAEAVALIVSRQPGAPGEALAESVRFRVGDFQSAAPGTLPPVEEWTIALLERTSKPDSKNLRAARLVTAASVHAAIRIEAAQAANQDVEFHLLCETTIRRITAAAVEGTRAGALPLAPSRSDLATRIVKASDDELFRGPI